MEHCEICKGTSFNKLFNVSDYRLKTTDKIFAVKKCTQCGHVILTPKPDAQDLDSYYPSSFYDSGKGSRLASINHKFALNRISRTARRGKLLDIGCGSGEFLKVAAQYGYEIYGQETSSEGASVAREKLGNTIHDEDLINCNFESDYFDVITLWHVAEHVYDLHPYFNEINRILKPDGALAIEVPNFDCIERIMFNGYSNHIDAPRHLRHFTRKTLERVLEDCGFACEMNNGWSLLISPLSILHAGKNFIHANIDGQKAGLAYYLTFLPLMLLSSITCLLNRFNYVNPIIGARCTKKEL